MEVTKKLLNEDGLHARPAGLLAKTASGFQCKVEVSYNGRTVNAKSSMSLMTLGLVKECEFQLKADGVDAEQALQVLSQIIDSKFQV